ncbi:hypothetical protein FRB91_005947, partial [Serendipita sp. 411]
MPTEPPSGDSKAVRELLQQVTVARYFAGVALTLCIYDWLILLGRESQTVWKARWTRTKAIYYINRILTLVGLTVTAIQDSDIWLTPLSQRLFFLHLVRPSAPADIVGPQQ